MDRTTRDRLVADHRRFPAALAALVGEVDAGRLRLRPAPEQWSPLEILVHLLDEEREDFGARARIAAGGGTIADRIDPQGWVSLRRYNERDPAAVLAELAVERERSCAWIAGLDDAQLERTASHLDARLAAMRCADFIAAWRVHDLLHLRQLSTTLVRLAMQELASHHLDYAGQLP